VFYVQTLEGGPVIDGLAQQQLVAALQSALGEL
jgi:hypothetical protein